ncbi:hypothetical protein [Chryseobacterium vrystaatense]|uniref:Uncharacterized protein n=1 Tax=Chryseobacterium vrystaatense TaxID=307480 RepID=A0A1M5E3C4_9FLAO|nr:hypothetical protein [Chryseobacterium vrystaatense]SHF73733.1 hypothetical protein SAMN02787073_2800 [Chryseobacterium vrystaatense]
MLSSADLHLERALFLIALIIFFGAGVSYTLIVFIINSIQKKTKNAQYYMLSFFISGIIVLALIASYFFMIFME